MAKFDQAMMDLYRYNGAILPRQRSIFSKNHSHTTTFDSAFLVPIMWDRVLPGDEKKIRYSGLARMATPIHPVMDEALLYTWCFFVPDRLWWNHAKEFYGENKDASFNPDGEYVMPYLKPSQYAVYGRSFTSDAAAASYGGIGSLNDYFGFPLCRDGARTPISEDLFDFTELDANPDTYCTAGLHRCYQLIWNEHFRNSSVQPALQLNDGDTVTDAEWRVIRQIRKVCKLPDRFTSLLREPQAGDDVLLPLGDRAPVVSSAEDIDIKRYYGDGIVANALPFNSALRLYDYIAGNGEGVSSVSDLIVDGRGVVKGFPLGDGNDINSYYHPGNLWADLTDATSATVNNLRAAVTVQQLLEVDAIGGKFYHSILAAHWGVFTPDATLQRSVLLGLSKTPIGIRQVLQTSETTGTSPQGNTAAVSVTNVANEWICNKAFTEPGFIMVLAAVRPIHSYSQGVNPLLRKLQRYDHYWPVFDHLGNQPVYASEILARFNDDDVDSTNGKYFSTVFGYKPAWDEYRTMNNRVSGLMRPDVNGTLASWNYSSYFSTAPVLNSAFVEEDPELIDRTIAVPSEPQFILDSYFEYTDIKNMSVKSVPGLTRL